MLRRLFVTLIVLFWSVMTGMLVVRELYPESSRLNEVPVPFLGKLLFQHLQSSDLQIYNDAKEIGYMHFQPKILRDGAELRMEFNGSLNFELPGMGSHHFSWIGNAQLDPALRLQKVQFYVASAGPGGQLEVTLDPIAHTASYSVREGTHSTEPVTFTTDEKGVAALLAQMGISPALLAQVRTQTSTMPAPDFTVQQSSTKLNGESIASYLFSMKMDEQVLRDAHLSQLGQVLRARVPLLGYKLAPAGIAP